MLRARRGGTEPPWICPHPAAMSGGWAILGVSACPGRQVRGESDTQGEEGSVVHALVTPTDGSGETSALRPRFAGAKGETHPGAGNREDRGDARPPRPGR